MFLRVVPFEGKMYFEKENNIEVAYSAVTIYAVRKKHLTG